MIDPPMDPPSPEASADEALRFMQVAIQAGLIPAPDGYSEEGQPMWSLEALADFFERTPAEIEAELARVTTDPFWKGPVYRRH